MSFASETGYVPVPISQMMDIVRQNVNTQFNLTHTTESFSGTNLYKYFYALIQRLQENEVKTSEIFQKLQEYFEVTNERLARPNTTAPGIIDYFKERGYFVSVKPPLDVDAGKLFICVDVDDGADDYEEIKAELCGYVKDCNVAGVVSQGSESTNIVLSNNQSFAFKYSLPDKTPVLLRLTLTLSENSEFAIGTPESTREKLMANIAARYRLGMDFEPQRYFSVLDAPWAAQVLLEWSDDAGSTWYDDIYDAEFDEIFTYGPGDIEIVEA